MRLFWIPSNHKILQQSKEVHHILSSDHLKMLWDMGFFEDPWNITFIITFSITMHNHHAYSAAAGITPVPPRSAPPVGPPPRGPATAAASVAPAAAGHSGARSKPPPRWKPRCHKPHCHRGWKPIHLLDLWEMKWHSALLQEKMQKMLGWKAFEKIHILPCYSPADLEEKMEMAGPWAMFHQILWRDEHQFWSLWA